MLLFSALVSSFLFLELERVANPYRYLLLVSVLVRARSTYMYWDLRWYIVNSAETRSRLPWPEYTYMGVRSQYARYR